MIGPVHLVSRKPADCPDKEIGDFAALVIKGGEVSLKGLEARIRSAVTLVSLSVGCSLCGVAALKRPKVTYRKRISAKSGLVLTERDFPFELGWVFVMPRARGRRFSADLTRAALESAGTDGVFSTSRTDNAQMHATLALFGFIPAGASWASSRGDHHVQVFLRTVAPATVEAAKLPLRP